MKELVNLMMVNNDKLENIKGAYGNTLLIKCNALTLTLKNQVADPIKIDECRNIIKGNTSLFSSFRGNSLIPTSVTLSLEENPVMAFKEMDIIYRKLRNHFSSSEYLALASNVLFKIKDKTDIDMAVLRTKEAYDIMKKNHRFLTSSEDVVTAAMIATNSMDLNSTFDEIEKCYAILNNNGFWAGENLQTLSHILALGEGTPEEKCEKVIKLNNALIKKNVSLKSYALPLLGVGTLVTDDYEDFSNKLSELNSYLKTQKGFGSFSLGGTERKMIGAGLICSSYFKDINKEVNEQIINTTSNISLTIMIAMEIACATAVCASVAAASASN